MHRVMGNDEKTSGKKSLEPDVKTVKIFSDSNFNKYTRCAVQKNRMHKLRVIPM